MFGKHITKTNTLESLVIASFARGLSGRHVEATPADALGNQAAISKSTVSQVVGDFGEISAPAHVRPRRWGEITASPSGALRADLSGLVLPHRRLGRATKPCSAISLATVFSLNRHPSARRSAIIRGDPYVSLWRANR